MKRFYIGFFIVFCAVVSSCRKDPIPPPVTPPYNGPVLCKTQLEQISVPANNMDTTFSSVGCTSPVYPIVEYSDRNYFEVSFNPENINQFAYVRRINTGFAIEQELWVHDICSNQSLLIYNGPLSQLSWTSAGWILFIGADQIYRIRPDGSQLNQTSISSTIFVSNRQGDKLLYRTQLGNTVYYKLADLTGLVYDTVYTHQTNVGNIHLSQWFAGDTLVTGRNPDGSRGPCFYVFGTAQQVQYFNPDNLSSNTTRMTRDLSKMICMNTNSIYASYPQSRTILRNGSMNRSYYTFDLSADGQYIIYARSNTRQTSPCDWYTEQRLYIMSTDGSYERELILP